MKCPIDGTDLVMSERNGIEIDYCPQCRGVWLDRGELDKIIERAAAFEAQAAPPPAQDTRKRKKDEDYYGDGDDYYDDDGYRRQPPYPRHKKKSFLGEMFDIFD